MKDGVNFKGQNRNKELARALNIKCTFIETDSYLRILDLVKNRHADVSVTSVVIMDIQQTDITGLETTRMMRQSEEGKRIPIVAVTPYVKASDRKISFWRGSRVISKNLLIRRLTELKGYL